VTGIARILRCSECHRVYEALGVRRVVNACGIYTDLGRTSTINVQKQISGKYVTVTGVGGQTNRSYKSALDLMEKHMDRIPFGEIVTHAYPLSQTEEAMKMAIREESMKIVIEP